jgi:hypothetical protein
MKLGLGRDGLWKMCFRASKLNLADKYLPVTGNASLEVELCAEGSTDLQECSHGIVATSVAKSRLFTRYRK